MPKAPAAITSPKIKKLATKAHNTPSMLTTAETRELGASVVAFLLPAKDATAPLAKKAPAKKVPAKKTVANKASAKKTVAKKVPAKKTTAKKAPAETISE